MAISSRDPSDSQQLLAPELAARVRQIQIRTHRLVNTALSGGYRSTFRGQGIEFQEVRPYQPGDDVRSIDWNVTARTGEAYVKTYAEERELTLNLLVDTSPSMEFGSRRWTKREAAAQVAALIAYVAIQHQDRVGLTLFGEKPGLHLPARKGSKHVLRIVREVLAARSTPGGSDLGAVLEQQLSTLHRRSLVFLFSDFPLPEKATQGDPGWFTNLARLALRHDVIAVRVIDPLERELPAAGLLTFSELESSRRTPLDSRSRIVRELWSACARERRARLADLFARARADWIDLDLGGDLADPLVSFFRRRAKQHGGRV
jgi:uncharacterized protein (DUF58 family)